MPDPDHRGDPLPGWDESTRPVTTAYDEISDADRAQGAHLRAIHDMYRRGLQQVGDILAAVTQQVHDGAGHPRDHEQAVAAARDAVQQLGLRAAVEQAGGFCGQICRAVEAHHRIEDTHLYPALRASDAALGDVLDRLDTEHGVVHAMLVRLDDTLVAVAREPERIGRLDHEFAHLRRLLESHFRYEEDQIGGPLGVHRVMV